MNHDKIKEKLTDYYDGELPLGENNTIAHHLNECRDCKNEIGQWETLSKTFFKTGPLPSTEAFVQQVMARLDRYEEPSLVSIPSRFEFLSRWFFPTFVSLALAGFTALAIFPAEETNVSVDAILINPVGHHMPAELLDSQSQKNGHILNDLVEDL